MGDGALVDMGDLSKPATVLIERVSDALGGCFRPYQIKRVARAEAEAKLIQAAGDIEVTELQRRALQRLLAEEADRQKNIESIVKGATELLGTAARPEAIDPDWLTNYLDKCRLVSDHEVQALWSRVLAEEANNPNQISRRTVTFLGTLDKRDALLFSQLSGFVWHINSEVPLIRDITDPICGRNGLSFLNMQHLDDIGLIKLNSVTGFKAFRLPKRMRVMYQDLDFELEFAGDSDNELELGHVLLTRVGVELLGMCERPRIDELVADTIQRWQEQGITISSPYPKRDTPSRSGAPPS